MAKFWPWVLDAKAKKAEVDDKDALDNALRAVQQAEEAYQAVEQSKKDATWAGEMDPDLLARGEPEEVAEAQRKRLESGKDLYRVQLRAHFAQLGHFVTENVPKAKQMWDQSQGRLEQKEAAFEKAMEECTFIVTVANEEDEFCSPSALAFNRPLLPVVAYLDLNQAPAPCLTQALKAIAHVGGGLLLFVTSSQPSIGMEWMLQKEAEVVRQVAAVEHIQIFRCFLRAI